MTPTEANHKRAMVILRERRPEIAGAIEAKLMADLGNVLDGYGDDEILDAEEDPSAVMAQLRPVDDLLTTEEMSAVSCALTKAMFEGRVEERARHYAALPAWRRRLEDVGNSLDGLRYWLPPPRARCALGWHCWDRLREENIVGDPVPTDIEVCFFCEEERRAKPEGHG